MSGRRKKEFTEDLRWLWREGPVKDLEASVGVLWWPVRARIREIGTDRKKKTQRGVVDLFWRRRSSDPCAIWDDQLLCVLHVNPEEPFETPYREGGVLHYCVLAPHEDLPWAFFTKKGPISDARFFAGLRDWCRERGAKFEESKEKVSA